MTIIISENGKNAKKIDQSTFDKEDYLQKYIYDNPESLPLYEIKEDIRLTILAREFPTKTGPIDAIGLDSDGQIYLIETKLYKNPDKRLVVAQVLDYGAALWQGYNNFADFLSVLERSVAKKFGCSVSQRLSQAFEVSEEDASYLLESARSNLDNGLFKFIVLMDHLHDRLKDLILFMNENSKFDIYAVELEYYRHDKYEIIIPRLFGAQVRKNLAGGSSSGKSWTEAEFFEEFSRNVADSATVAAARDLFAFARERGSKDPLQTKKSRLGAFSFFIEDSGATYALFTVAGDGAINLYYLQENPDYTAHLREKGLAVREDATSRNLKLSELLKYITLQDFKARVLQTL